MTRLLFAFLLFGACFSSGDQPTLPGEVRTVFHVAESDDRCGPFMYIADVAFGETFGYAYTLPYFRETDGDMCPTNVQVELPVYRFGFAPTDEESSTEQVGNVGRSSQGFSVNSPPRVAASGPDSAAWLYGDSNDGARTNLVGASPALIPLQTAGGVGGGYTPGGMAADTMTLYFALKRSGSGGGGGGGMIRTWPNDPQYPSGDGSTFPDDSTYDLFAKTWGDATAPDRLFEEPGAPDPAIPLEPKLNCIWAKQCMIDNFDSLFFIEHKDLTGTAGSLLTRWTKDTHVKSQLGIVEAGKGVPVGFAATPTTFVFTVSNREFSPLICELTSVDLAPSGVITTLFNTMSFSCMDAAIDATHAYFAIVEVTESGQRMRGLGIGRVALAPPHEFESIRHGITGQSRGPRRVYVGGGSEVYAVDPFAIGAIKKSAFEGRHDFER